MSEYRFGSVTKDPDETRSVVLSFYSMCVLTWRRNEQFDPNEVIRPTRPTGFAYQASTDGTSGMREPSWPKTLGGTVQDGSIIWTAVAAGTTGLNAITQIMAEDESGGLGPLSPLVIESVKVAIDYTGGTDGQDCVVKFTATINGSPRVARQVVKIRER